MEAVLLVSAVVAVVMVLGTVMEAWRKRRPTRRIHGDVDGPHGAHGYWDRNDGPGDGGGSSGGDGGGGGGD